MYLARVAECTRRELGAALGGVYATGSFALGDYVPGRSDLDVVVVAGRRPSRARLGRLAGVLDHERLPCPARKLEYVVYPLAEMRRPGRAPRFALNLETGPGGTRAGFDPTAEPAHWFAIDLAVARRHGRPLRGPPAAELIGAPAPAALRTAVNDALAWYARHAQPGELALTACRAWCHAATGEWCSKTSAARWAIGQLADPAVVERALEQRRGEAVAVPAQAAQALAHDVRSLLGPGTG